jgi:Dipeptidyl aminopeptidases/acylaminoacyl-peptidases
MKKLLKPLFFGVLLSAIATISLRAQNTDSINSSVQNQILEEIRSLRKTVDDYRYTYDVIIKRVDDLMWHTMLNDIAHVDKVRLTGPPRWKPKTKNDRFAANPLHFSCYVFIPKNINPNKKYPLIVFPHSGIHSDFSSTNAHIVREFIAQGYIVVSAEYRGSTGYGKSVYENIDYGGLENEDVLASRNYMVENYSIVDANRVGIVGWSHGGMIAMMNILKYPDLYNCAYAGVPVSDLENRLASHTASYTANFTADYHIGESIKDNPEEYKRRSPSTYAANLTKPLLIYTNTNDNDVYVEEVLLMIDSLKAHNRIFEYKVFDAFPGGHSFDRIDNGGSTEIRFSIHKYLEKHLNPPKPFHNHKEMRKAAYRY